MPSEAADAFFDFDLDDEDEEPESPGSPIDECEYTRLIETAATTPLQDHACEMTSSVDVESGYSCSSPCSSGETDGGGDDNSACSSNKSSESQYYDPPENNSTEAQMSNDGSTALQYYDCMDGMKIIVNGHVHAIVESTDTSESLPPSQSTDSNLTNSALNSASSYTLQEEEGVEMEPQQAVEAQEEPEPEEEVIEVEIKKEEKSEESSQDVVDNAAPDNAAKLTRLPSIVETDEETEEEQPSRLRRSSSLKSGKTPPGTPGRKKFVRFADVFGLDLADVKMFLDNEVPKIPKSAFEDLDYKTEPEIKVQFGPPLEKVLLPLFQQPGGLPNFLDKVREKQVSLENAAVTDPTNLTISGTVRVRNLDFHKSVYIRYSSDNWASYSDLQANYCDGSCDGFSDTFTFTLFGNSLQIGQRLEMAIRFHCRGQQFWDNNFDTNYCFQCLPATNMQQQQQKPKEPDPIQPSPTSDYASGAFY